MTAAPEDVTVESAYIGRLKRYRYSAECHVPGCTWAGKVRDSFTDANADRRRHLNDHLITDITPEKGDARR